jgi:hypothetical protein
VEEHEKVWIYVNLNHEIKVFDDDSLNGNFRSDNINVCLYTNRTWTFSCRKNVRKLP